MKAEEPVAQDLGIAPVTCCDCGQKIVGAVYAFNSSFACESCTRASCKGQSETEIQAELRYRYYEAIWAFEERRRSREQESFWNRE